MIDVIFKAVQKRVKNKLPYINEVMMYQQNDILQQGSLPFLPPVLMVSFENIQPKSFTNKVQLFAVDVVIRFVFEEYHENYLDGIKLKQDIAYHLNFWSDGWGGTGFVQDNNETDEKADSLYVYKLRFKTSYFEVFTNVLYTGGTNGNYNINLSLQNIGKNGTSGFASGGIII